MPPYACNRAAGSAIRHFPWATLPRFLPPTPIPQGAKKAQIFTIFSGLPGPKLRDSGPGAVTGLFATFFRARGLTEGPGDVENTNFPAGPGTDEFSIFYGGYGETEDFRHVPGGLGLGGPRS